MPKLPSTIPPIPAEFERIYQKVVKREAKIGVVYTDDEIRRIVDGTSNVFNFSTLETFSNCPRQGYYNYILCKIIDKVPPLPLVFGSAMHKAWEVRYKGLIGKPPGTVTDRDETLADMKGAFVYDAIKAMHDGVLPLDQKDSPDGRRSVIKAFDLIEEYYDNYPAEPFEVVDVECPFAVTVSLDGEEDVGEIIYVGRIDLMIKKLHGGKELYAIVDHKTTSITDRFWKGLFDLSHQMSGYVFAANEFFDYPVESGFVNAAGVFSDRISLERIPFSRTKHQIQNEFLPHLKKRSAEIIACLRLLREGYDFRDLFPQTPSNCSRYHMWCQYRPLCTCRGDKTYKALLEGAYRNDIWQPYIDIDDVLERSYLMEKGEGEDGNYSYYGD